MKTKGQAPPPTNAAGIPELTSAVELLVGKLTEINAINRGLSLNHVLHSGTVIVGDDGYAVLEFAIPMAHVAVLAAGAAGDVTIAAASPAEPVPTSGIGVAVAPTTLNFLSIPLVGPTLTVYGTPGDELWIGVWSRPQVPSAS